MILHFNISRSIHIFIYLILLRTLCIISVSTSKRVRKVLDTRFFVHRRDSYVPLETISPSDRLYVLDVGILYTFNRIPSLRIMEFKDIDLLSSYVAV